jgi:hypothetical protein
LGFKGGCWMNKLWFDAWKLIWWHAYVDLQMWLSNEQIVIQCLEPSSITCSCWFAHVDGKWTKLWFDAWKLILWHAYVDLRICMSNVQIMIRHLRNLFDIMSICTRRCQMNQIVIQHLQAYSTCLCQFANVEWTNCSLDMDFVSHVLSRWTNFRSMCFQHVFMRCGMNTISVSVKTESKNLITWWFDFKIHVMSLWLGSFWQKANLTGIRNT